MARKAVGFFHPNYNIKTKINKDFSGVYFLCLKMVFRDFFLTLKNQETEKESQINI